MGGCISRHSAVSHSVFSSLSDQDEYRPFPSHIKQHVGPILSHPAPPGSQAFPLPPPPPHSGGIEAELNEHGLKVYSLSQLSRATNGFNDANLLGQGGFGKVYKGFLPPVEETAGTNALIPVAVKRLASYRHTGQSEWLKEILVLSKIFHPNLVLLLGYCTEKAERLLVFEFLPFGSLDYHLFADPRKFTALSWPNRLKIAIGSAKGLAHLHRRHVIHRDFKAQNILLDTNFNVKLTDFGMARETEADKSHVSTLVMGTIGYLDPNYGSTGRLTAKSDVYSYGVLLLELLTGRRAMQSLTDGKQLPLVLWVQPMLLEEVPNIHNLMDPYMQPPFPDDVALGMAYIARRCVSRDMKMRPDMQEILQELSSFQQLIQ